MINNKKNVKEAEVVKTTPSTDKKTAIPYEQWLKEKSKKGTKRFMQALVAGIAILSFVLSKGASGALKLGYLYIFMNDGKISGRTSGDVKMRNGRGRAMAFFAPVRNAYTLAVRSSFGTNSSGWNSLTDANRFTWQNYDYKTTDRFANIVTVSGKDAYVGINGNLSKIGEAPISDAPIGVAPPAATVLTALAGDASASTLALTYTTNGVGDATVIRATKGLSIGTSKPGKNQFRIIAVIDTSAAGPSALGTAYENKFGNLVANTRIFVTAEVVDIANGVISQESGVQCIVAA